MTEEEAQWGDASDAPRRGSRAARSLGLLCSRFLELYASQTCGESHLSLDHAAASLGVERRRMYDVVGILEACEVVVRRGKNSYTWYGLTRLPLALDRLRQSAARCEEGGTDADAAGGSSGDDEAGCGDGGGRGESRKDKSLGLLSQRFLQLFLAADSSVLSLEEAAQLLLGAEAGDAAKLKTKVRRLYDIANVLVSLQLIEKVHVDSRKPAFRWVGAAGGADPVATPLEAIPPPLAAPAKRAAAPSHTAQRKQPRRERAGAAAFAAAPPTAGEAPAVAQARRRRAAAIPGAQDLASQDAANAPVAGTTPHTAYLYGSQSLTSTFALYSQTVASIVGAAAAEHRT